MKMTAVRDLWMVPVLSLIHILEKIYFIAPTDINDDEAFGIFQNLFAGPKPLIGVFSLKDLKTSSALLDVSLDKLNITNPSTSPYALEVSLEHLKMPVALVPELQLLSVMGVPEIDASASYALSLIHICIPRRYSSTAKKTLEA